MTSTKSLYAITQLKLKHIIQRNLCFIFIAMFICSLAFVAPNAHSQEKTNSVLPKNDTEPFNNMARKFVLLAQEILAEKEKKPETTAAVKTTTPATTAATPEKKPAEAKAEEPAKQLPTTSITATSAPQVTDLSQPAVQAAAPVANPAISSADIPTQNAAPQTQAPATTQKLQLDEPIVEELKLPPPPVIGAEPPNKDGGLLNKILAQPEDKKNLPLPVMPRRTPKPVEIKPAEPVPPKNTKPYPNEKPDTNYRTQRLPDEISKKSYSRDNEHLPRAVYSDEYKKILFDSAATGNLDVLRAMLDNYKDTELLNEQGDTPLIYSTMAGNIESMLTLLSMDANVNAQNFYGVSSLYVATKLGRIDLVKLLLSRKAKTDLADKNGMTPLMIACQMDFATIAGMLVESGASLEAKMRNGNMAIHLCANDNSLASLNLLITKGTDIEIRNYKGQTPLMLAVANGQQQAASLLINAGADISKKNAQGLDVTAFAKKSGNAAISDVLENEKNRQNLLAQQLLTTKRNQIAVSDIEPISTPDESIAHRENGIPLPVMRPGKKTATSKPAPSMPKPSFSKEEMEKMKNSGM